MAKETAKETNKKVKFEHKDIPYFRFTYGRIVCQFANYIYETDNEIHIKALREYSHNTGYVREIK